MADRTDSPCEAMSAGERVTLHRTRRRRNGKLTEYGPWYECDGIHVGGNWQHAPYVPARLLDEAMATAHQDGMQAGEMHERERCAKIIDPPPDRCVGANVDGRHEIGCMTDERKRLAAKIREGK